jgi:hypothetical protein
MVRLPDVAHEAPIEPIHTAFALWSKSLGDEHSNRVQWIGTTSHRMSLENKRPEEMQPDGSVQSSPDDDRDEATELTFVVESANSQSMSNVRQKVGRWLLRRGVRAALIINIEYEEKSTDKETLKLSFELWRKAWLTTDEFTGLAPHGTAFKDTNIMYARGGLMWLRGASSTDGQFVAMLCQYGGPYNVIGVRVPSDEMNKMLISGRRQA